MSDQTQLTSQMRDMVDKTIQRSIKGIDYVRSGSAAVGLTPKDVILEQGTMRLYHYEPMVEEVYRIPLLIVMATTNKGYLFDILPGQSMVEYLLKEGFDVFMLDWAPPVMQERGLGLEDYTQGFLPMCIEAVQETSGEADVNIIGYCQGGVLSLIYASTHPAGPLKNLVCLTTPIDMHQMGLFRLWSNEEYMDLDNMVDTLGIIPAEFISNSFEMLRPAQRSAGQMRLWDQLWNDDFVTNYRAFQRWGDETLPLPGEYHRDCTRELMWENKFFKGELKQRGNVANLKNVTIPLMAVMAEHDHIAPYEATKPLLDLVGSEDRQELVLKGGHVSLIAGPNAMRRMWPPVNAWLAERSV
ncbi:MAG: alpha/beta fold hydrolase [Pseudomonadales bacterium]|nr:alpha/beta fold hydrolase [Pseudomonadales bacterium]MBO6563517.1 alpha/beta fold hydrolase [Pseudomonadales bacterium]MBO6596831.1 alpha/beta fold hydrolase [Pseudomonadales bacterium]MBO6659011.1 alpha/beta fold hydrolase [Pseudomonadales bacterium]MBO6703502.1 alpha/beta fold hydrolase [Pseudomonadales bacterium]